MEKDSYTKDELYSVLSAVDVRTRQDLIYHCRKAAEEMQRDLDHDKEAKSLTQGEQDQIVKEIAVLRSVQALSTRASKDIEDLDK